MLMFSFFLVPATSDLRRPPLLVFLAPAFLRVPITLHFVPTMLAVLPARLSDLRAHWAPPL